MPYPNFLPPFNGLGLHVREHVPGLRLTGDIPQATFECPKGFYTTEVYYVDTIKRFRDYLKREDGPATGVRGSPLTPPPSRHRPGVMEAVEGERALTYLPSSHPTHAAEFARASRRPPPPAKAFLTKVSSRARQGFREKEKTRSRRPVPDRAVANPDGGTLAVPRRAGQAAGPH